jgi:hypothetical protein
LEHLEVIGLVPADLTKSVKRTREALDAKHPEFETPDHPVRLKAARQFFELADVLPKSTVHQSLTGGGSLTVVWDVSAREIHPASDRTALSSTSSNGSNGSTSSSVIEDGERPPSA